MSTACIAKAPLGHTFCGRQEPLEFHFNDVDYAVAFYIRGHLVACPACVEMVRRMRAVEAEARAK
jgi:hypothetical protein